MRLTPEGIKRAEEVTPQESITHRTGRKLIGITIALAVIAAGLLVFRFTLPKPPPSAGRSVTSTPAPAAASPAIAEKSIAVLPFENLSEDVHRISGTYPERTRLACALPFQS
ncbi:MAG: hypothetical protein H0X73_05735 [Chthoniobacterales bacterium]|nr:hypothetical protein [Chthoniobacterales bacterium]